MDYAALAKVLHEIMPDSVSEVERYLNLVCDEPCAEIEIKAPYAVRTEVITTPPHAKSLSRRTNIIKKYHGVYKKATRHLVEG